jgi:hypothetical protein
MDSAKRRQLELRRISLQRSIRAHDMRETLQRTWVGRESLRREFLERLQRLTPISGPTSPFLGMRESARFVRAFYRQVPTIEFTQLSTGVFETVLSAIQDFAPKLHGKHVLLIASVQSTTVGVVRVPARVTLFHATELVDEQNDLALATEQLKDGLRFGYYSTGLGTFLELSAWGLFQNLALNSRNAHY